MTTSTGTPHPETSASASSPIATPEEQTSTGPRLRVPLLVALLFAMIAMFGSYLGIIPMLLLSLIPGLKEAVNDNNAVGVLFSLLQSALIGATGVLIVWALMKFVCRRPISRAGWIFTPRSLPLLLTGIAISCLVTVPVMFALHAQGLVPDADDTGLPAWAFIIVSLGTGIVMQGLPEELIWRGYAMQLMERRPVLAAVVSALLFGVMHLVSQGGQQNAVDHLLYLAPATGFGFAAAATVLLTKSVWTAVGIHGGSHVANMMLNLNGVGETSRVAWLSVGAAYVVVGLIMLAIWSRRQRGQAEPDQVEYLH